MAAEVNSFKGPVGNQPRVDQYHNFLKNYADDSTLTAEQKSAKLYDGWTTYEEDLVKASYNGASLSAMILSKLCPDKTISVLDCGAGSGLVGEQLVAQGFTNLIGNDISQKLLDIAQKKNIYKKLVCCDAGNVVQLPFEQNEFDAIVCVGCVSPTGIRPKAFVDWARVVKPGGVFLFLGRHRYWKKDPKNEWPELGFLEEFNTVVRDLQNSKKVQMIFKRILPDYLEKTEGVAFAFRVL
ncbi:Methyltransferase-like protein 27 [Holothuria leucospilota]|uniref:Methyltransferase-like protein 27 n=1 Tax=Holothuria leucospilota TaxID=206669 RepID=A0A9Q0YMF2_HOLLE|nr:Methyltransferase-like protein 27 [Holothuria leucospilota]